jgi:hypothetical protein
VLVLAGLSACDTKAGAAAFVGGDRISDGDVSRFLTAKSTPYRNNAQAEVRPKSLVLATLIQQRLLEHGLAAKGGAPTDAELDAFKTGVLQGLSDDQLTAEITGSNYTAAFEAAFVRAQEMFALLGQRVGATTGGEVIAALDQMNVPVRVSARYGTWDGSQLALRNGVDPELSPVLTLEPTTPAAAAPQP